MAKHGDYRWKGWEDAAKRRPTATPAPIYGTTSAFTEADETIAVVRAGAGTAEQGEAANTPPEPPGRYATREQRQRLRELRRAHRIPLAGGDRKDLVALTFTEAAQEIEELA